MNEEFRPIKNYEGIYEISNFGRVRRIKGGQGAIIGRVLTPKTNKKGYCYVDLSVNDKKKRIFIHQLVATAFIEKLSNNLVVNHKDTIKTNNSVTNLEWVTLGENVKHAHKMGVMPSQRGELNHRAKLTAEQVIEIRDLKGKLGKRKVAEMYGVSHTTIKWIFQGKSWK